MKLCKNPRVFDLTATWKERTYSLSSIKLPEGLKKCCVWCLDPLKGLQRRWCGEECVKEALVWGRPQSYHGLRVILDRQSYKCATCPQDWRKHMDQAIPPTSKFFGREDLNSGEIELVMKRFRRLIPIGIRPEIDHVTAIVLGGTALGTDNHQALCAVCHKAKTKTDIKEKFARNPNPRKGVKFTEEHIQALSEARKGVDTEARIQSRQENLYPLLKIPIIAVNVETKEELHFDSIQDAALALNLQESNISRVLGGKQNRKQHKGWTFIAK